MVPASTEQTWCSAEALRQCAPSNRIIGEQLQDRAKNKDNGPAAPSEHGAPSVFKVDVVTQIFIETVPISSEMQQSQMFVRVQFS